MNRSLWIGLIGTTLLLLVILFGSAIAPHTMNDLGIFKDVTGPDGVVHKITTPFPPSADNWLGSDANGRDLLSIILRGARITVTFAVAVAVVRIVVGLPLAYLGSLMPRTVGWLNEKASLAFTTVPAVLIVALLSGIFNISDAFTPAQNLTIMSCLTALVGLFPTAFVLQQKFETLLKSPFMEGQRAIGTGKWRILRKHLLPHLSAYVTVLFVSEIAQVLWLVAQLGVLYVFIGGAIQQEGTPPSMRFPEEWAGEIGASFRIFRAHPMVVLWPVISLSLAILSFNMLAEGIRKFQERKWGIGL
jgi:peptide/nickel transport system permease protein